MSLLRCVNSWALCWQHGPKLSYDAPRHCHECGKAYPWTERALEAARDLIALSDRLSIQEKEDFGRAVADVTTDTPRSKVAAQKIKIYSAKAGREIAQGVRDIAVNIASETMKKILLGG
jgi:hypothetical protein